MTFAEASRVPHRYRSFWLTEFLETNGVDKLIAIKNVTVNEPQFTGHFPGVPADRGLGHDYCCSLFVVYLTITLHRCVGYSFVRVLAANVLSGGGNETKMFAFMRQEHILELRSRRSVMNAAQLCDIQGL